MRKTIWISEDKLNKIDWIIKYNKACDKWKYANMDDISLFYSYFTVNEHKLFVEEILNKINLKLNGVGLEIGAGPGILSNSVLKLSEKVKKIYLLEKVPNTYNLMKKVAKENNTIDKLECIIGSFNDLKFKDNSLDFVLDFDSIHHSEDFDRTFKEIARVLKPNGVLICFDRAQPNYIKNEQIEDMLNIEYSKTYKLENNIDINKKFTRRMNGEHEPLLKDWISTANKYRLRSKIYIFHKRGLKDFFRAIYGLLIPYQLKKIINKGINITTHYQVLLNYFGIDKYNNIRVFKLDYKLKSRRSPRGKMILIFSKN